MTAVIMAVIIITMDLLLLFEMIRYRDKNLNLIGYSGELSKG